MKKIFKENVTVEEINNSILKAEGEGVISWVKRNVENPKKKEDWPISCFIVKFGKMEKISDTSDLYSISVNYTYTYNGKKRRKPSICHINDIEDLAKDIIGNIAYMIKEDVISKVRSYKFDDEEMAFDRYLTEEGVKFMDLDRSENEYFVREFAEMMSDEFKAFFFGNKEKKAEMVKENRKVYDQWRIETNTYMWDEAQKAIYTMTPDEFKAFLYNDTQALPEEERYIERLESEEETAETENSADETENKGIEMEKEFDTPSLDGADEIMDAIMTGNYEENVVVGEMLDDEGEIVGISVSENREIGGIDLHSINDGKELKTVHIRYFNEKCIAHALAELCKKDKDEDEIRDYMMTMADDVDVEEDDVDERFNDICEDVAYKYNIEIDYIINNIWGYNDYMEYLGLLDDPCDGPESDSNEKGKMLERMEAVENIAAETYMRSFERKTGYMKVPIRLNGKDTEIDLKYDMGASEIGGGYYDIDLARTLPKWSVNDIAEAILELSKAMEDIHDTYEGFFKLPENKFKDPDDCATKHNKVLQELADKYDGKFHPLVKKGDVVKRKDGVDVDMTYWETEY